MFERISFGLYVYVIFFNYQKGVAPVMHHALDKNGFNHPIAMTGGGLGRHSHRRPPRR